MEMARLLKDVETEYSIKFIHFSGEEDGLIGSEYYVNNTVNPQNLDIKLVFNIDEVGGLAGTNNDTIVCERDQSFPPTNNAASSVYTDNLATLIELYSTLETEISHAYASDYIPFENNNEIITGLFEKNETPYAHTANDLLINMDVPYLFQVTKGSVGAALEFAGAFETLGVEEQIELDNSISISPNPTHDFLNISFEKPLTQPVNFKLIDMLGKKVYENTFDEQSQTISIDSLSASQYFAVFKLNNKRLIKAYCYKLIMRFFQYIIVLLPFTFLAQEQINSKQFWTKLQTHCGKAYEGEIIAGGKPGDGFTGETLIMHVRSCDTNNIRIPFFVGDNKSRTWVLNKKC